MTGDKISEEGRKARFEQWETLGLEAIKADLASGGHRLGGGPPQAQARAPGGGRVKEAAAAAAARAENDTCGTMRDVVAGRDRSFERAVAAAVAPGDESGNASASATQETRSPSRPAARELLTLKPTFMGMSIDLK